MVTTIERRATHPDQTREAGALLAATARPGDVYALVGTLGAGKTEFVRGFVASMQPDAPVRSPTFALVYTYETGHFPVYHFDLYRMCSAAELVQIGFEDYVWGQGVCLIEWADMFMEALPEHAVTVHFTIEPDGTRLISWPQSSAG